MKLLQGARAFFKEISDFVRLFDKKNRKLRTLVFYSERAIYYQYYEGYIRHILDESDLEVAYLTSDLQDPIFDCENDRIKPFYIKNFLLSALQKLDSKVLVMTMPDLDLYNIERARNPVNYVYLFHGVGSTHLQYNKTAFDAYDTILCIGSRDRDEIRRAEAIYKRPRKTLIECGYYRIEKIFLSHQEFVSRQRETETKTILIAPSWHDDNILQHCRHEVIDALRGTSFRVVVRPHPEFIHRNPRAIETLKHELKDVSNFELELEMTKVTSIHEADVLMTDWSAISFEFAYGTERPVLFINSPCRIQNPDYKDLGVEPIEFTIRDEIGKAIDVAEIRNLPSILDDFIQNGDVYRERIVESRKQQLSNWLESAAVGGKYLIDACQEKSTTAAKQDGAPHGETG